MKPESEIPANRSPLVDRFVHRCLRLIEKDFPAARVTLIPEEKEDHLNVPEQEKSLHFSAAQIYVSGEREIVSDYDFLLFALLEFPPEKEEARSTIDFSIINPESLRSASRYSGRGISIDSIKIRELGRLPSSISLALYKIGKNDRNQRLVEILDRLAGALNFKRDFSGSVHLAHSVLDRLEVLAGFEDVQPVIGGKYLLQGQKEVRSQNHYLAFFSDDFQLESERKLWISNRNLFVGKTKRTAAPLDTRNFLLFRIGDKLRQENQIRYIYELRRQYLLSNAVAGLPLDDSGENLFVREAKIRKERNIERLKMKFDNGSASFELIPVVTPLALEVASDLIYLFENPSGGGKLAPEFQEKMNAFREDFALTWGVKVPGIRVRGNVSDMAPGTYLVMINEVPIVMGTAPNDEVFVQQNVDELNKLGISGTETTDPADGSECTWVKKEDIGLLDEKEVKYLSNLGYIFRHLSAVITSNMNRYLGVQEVQNLIEDDYAPLESEIKKSDGGLPLFTNVLRALLDERVPITELEIIAKKYIELRAQKVPSYEIVDQIRLLEPVRSQLRGNHGNFRRYFTLDDTIIAALEKGTILNEDHALLALEPEVTQEVLTAIRYEQPDPKDGPILAKNGPCRALIRKLVELEHPHLHVLSQQEKLPGLDFGKEIIIKSE